MAIGAEIEVPAFGVSANYHRIAQVLFVYDPDPQVQGSAGSAYATVVSYPSRETRDAGRGAIDKVDFQIRFGVSVSATLNDARPESDYEAPKRDENGHIIYHEDGRAVMEWVNVPARAATPVPVIASDDPTRADIYAVVMAQPQFAESEVV